MQYRYRWTKNGRELDVDTEPGISQRPGKGTISIDIQELQSHHDGLYQCIASNQFGTAVSVKALLKRASTSPCVVFLYIIARSEERLYTLYRHFFGRLKIILQLLSGRMVAIPVWKSLTLLFVLPGAFPEQYDAKNAFVAGAPPETPLHGELSALLQTP